MGGTELGTGENFPTVVSRAFEVAPIVSRWWGQFRSPFNNGGTWVGHEWWGRGVEGTRRRGYRSLCARQRADSSLKGQAQVCSVSSEHFKSIIWKLDEEAGSQAGLGKKYCLWHLHLFHWGGETTPSSDSSPPMQVAPSWGQLALEGWWGYPKTARGYITWHIASAH